jgi:hypothetical protein
MGFLGFALGRQSLPELRAHRAKCFKPLRYSVF